MAIASKEARFKDYDSAESRGTLCLLADHYGRGKHLGQVYAVNGSWVWESAETDYDDDEDDSRGNESSRRKAKTALRKYLKAEGILK